MAKSIAIPASAVDFMLLLQEELSDVSRERTVGARFTSGSVYVSFYNLPESRVKERRGGGAEAENNRQLFFVSGFGSNQNDTVESVRVEQAVNGICDENRTFASKLRSKSGSPAKIAKYLADYINDVAENFQPIYTHD
jgi:hypothetical protein